MNPSTRKLIEKVEPAISPQGTVNNISVLVGNPVLVETTLRAVKTWKWEPADSESTVHVNATFNPDE